MRFFLSWPFWFFLFFPNEKQLGGLYAVTFISALWMVSSESRKILHSIYYAQDCMWWKMASMWFYKKLLHYPKIASFQVIFVVKVFLIKSMSEVTLWIYDKSGSHYACKTKGPTEFKKSWNKSRKKGRNPFLSSGGPVLSLPSLGLGTICPKNGKWAYDDHPCHIFSIQSTMKPNQGSVAPL